jgi:hypothetical protein
MTVEEIIDQELSQGDLVPSTDSAYVERRRRALTALRSTFHEIYFLRDWPWKKKQGSIVVPASTGFKVAPTDFSSIGVFGGLYRPDNVMLQEVPESVIYDSRNSGERSDDPRIFAIFGQDALTYKPLFQFPMNDGSYTLTLWYQPEPPTLLDAGDPDETPGAPLTAGNAALQVIPVEFHESVLAMGLKAKLRESKGDARWQWAQTEFEKAKLAMYRAAARGQSDGMKQIPSFFGSVGRSRY